MWKIIVFVAVWTIVGASGRSIEQIEGPLWSPSINVLSREHQLAQDIYKNPYTYYIPKNKGDYYEYELRQPTYPKRGFSLLARWRPFNNIGKNRSSIREHNDKLKALIDQDVVMETRAHSRPAGQPLRWG